MKVLLLYAKVGNGHLKAAEFIRDELKKLDENIDIFFEDGLEYSSALTNKLIIKGYASMAKTAPVIYGTIYNKSDTQDTNTVGEINKMVNKAMTIRLKKMIRKLSPDVIVSTHPFISHMCGYLKRKGKTDAKILSIFTDYGIHNMWLEENESIDKLLMATDEMKKDCIREYEVDESKIAVTGIPVSPKFKQEYNKKEILDELGLKENKKTILFCAGGGLGLGKSDELLEEMLESNYDFQLIVVTGKNEKQKAAFEKMVKKYSKDVCILGYTNKMPELMYVSDAVMTKPGGLTSTECLTMKKPMIIINPIPGQEEQNAIFFTNHGMALRMYKNEPVEHVLDIVMNNSKRLEQMKEMCEMYMRPDSALKVAQEIINIYDK